MRTRKTLKSNNQKFHRPDTEAESWTITIAIPYVNAKPHIGFAPEMTQADVLARFRRSQGYTDGLGASVAALSQWVGDCVENFSFHDALAAIWETIALTNQRISVSAPWSLANRCQAAGSPAEAAEARSDLVRSLIGPVCALNKVANALVPFMPTTSARLFKTFASVFIARCDRLISLPEGFRANHDDRKIDQ